MQASSVRILMERAVKKTPAGLTGHSDSRLKIASPAYLTESQVNVFLDRIACPVLVILAENGLLVGRKRLETRMASFSDLQSVWLPGGIICTWMHHSL